MKAAYSPDSLQNTLNGKEQFSFNMSKRKDINPYASRLEKTSTCRRKGLKFPCERNFLNLFLMPPSFLPDDILNQVDYWLRAVQHRLHSTSSGDKFRSTGRAYHLEKSKPKEMLLGFCFRFHVHCYEFF